MRTIIGFIRLVLLVLVVGVAFAPGPAAAQTPDDLRKTCVEAMNKNEAFADDIIRIAEGKRAKKIDDELILNDRCTIKLHNDAQQSIAKNERHVILAYAAMWVVAAGFVLFLWRRQQALKAEIVRLRHDLDAATKDAK